MAKFIKGRSGNPGGRPKKVAEIEILARASCSTAIEVLTEIVRNKRAPSSARISAANSLLTRGYGSPRQSNTLRIIRSIRDLEDEELQAMIDEQVAPNDTH